MCVNEEVDASSGLSAERISLEREDDVIKRIVDPILPSKSEVDRHFMSGHIPYRNWCPVCIKARGREMDHSQCADRERKIPEYSFDYCFPGDEFGFKWTVLVGQERMSKAWMATAVPMKGSSGRFAVDKCLEDRKSTRLNSSHSQQSRMPSSA